MKATRTTLKSFIKRNANNLFINKTRSFDGMVDGCTSTGSKGFSPAVMTDLHLENTYGVEGVWLVGGGRDYIKPFTNGEFSGFEVFNCCGSFFLATKN